MRAWSKLRGIQIISVCGQRERAAAETMIEARQAKRIALADFPAGAPRRDAAGRAAAFAIVVDGYRLRTFNALLAEWGVG